MHTFHSSSVPTGCVTDGLSSGSGGKVEPSQTANGGRKMAGTARGQTMFHVAFPEFDCFLGSGTDILHYNWEFGTGVTCQERRWLNNSAANTAQHFALTLVIYSAPF
jgi:hypothetical protein